MGGRWQQGRSTMSDYQPLDVRQLQRGGFLEPAGAVAAVQSYGRHCPTNPSIYYLKALSFIVFPKAEGFRCLSRRNVGQRFQV